MATFKDRAGREWRVEIDCFAIEQVSNRTEVRLDRLFADQMTGLSDLLGDVVKVVRVLWVLVEDQAAKIPVSPEQFARGLGGDALDAAARAFLEALADFYPSHQRRVLKALVAKKEEVLAAAAEKAVRGIEETSFDSPTSSPPSSESTPAPAAG